MIKIGLIDYYLDQFHAQYYPKWLKEISGGEVQVTAAWAKIDFPGGRTNEQCCQEGGFALLDSPEAVIEQCDGLIVMSPDHAEMHEELCRLPLASGKPAYVDKTFAVDRATALRIMENADKHGTPFFSTSSVRYADEYRALKKDGLAFINHCGPGYFDTYAIHLLEPIVFLMGPDIESIRFIGTNVVPAFELRFKDGRGATMAQFGDGDFALTAKYTDAPTAQVKVQSDFYRRFLTDLTAFFQDNQPRVPAEETLKIMTILEYGRKAMKSSGTRIVLPD